MNYSEISKETISYLYKSYASLKNSPLEPSIRILVELRTSQINGCAYCCQLHIKEAREANVSHEKLDLLAVWQNSSVFTDKEVAALKWCEAITHIDKKFAPQQQDILFTLFNEREIVDLTACVALMNALNRLAISLK